MTALEILEAGAREAEAALAELKDLWKREDEATAANRAAVLEAHAQGARDRDAMRVQMGGASTAPSTPDPRRPRASSLPAEPLAALGQTAKP